MDELKHRRQLYTDPVHVPADTQAALLQDPSLQQLHQELVALDHQLQRALQLPVPTALQDRLLQISHDETPIPTRQPWRLAIAASTVLFALSAAFWWYQTPQSLRVGEQALAHVYHEPNALVSTQQVSDSDMAQLVAEIHARWTHSDLQVSYARYCHFDGLRSLHIVVRVDGKPVSLFVLPAQHQLRQSPQFADQRFVGESVQIAGRDVVFVAEERQLIPKTQQMLMNSLAFTG